MSIENLLNPTDDEAVAEGHAIVDEKSDLVGSAIRVFIEYKSDGPSDASSTQSPEAFSRAISPSKSTSSSSSTQSKPRDFRPAYEAEQGYFLWWSKIDQDQDWPTISETFRATFPEDGRKKPGLQCKFYRVLSDHGMPTQRVLARMPAEQRKGHYGFLSNRNERYSWTIQHGSMPTSTQDSLEDRVLANV